jgi:hypothetical protein
VYLFKESRQKKKRNRAFHRETELGPRDRVGWFSVNALFSVASIFHIRLKLPVIFFLPLYIRIGVDIY